MIGLVWSLVSSVVETARRRRLAAFLADFLAHVENDGLMIVCRHITSVTSSPSSTGLTRFSSDPQISTVSNNNRSVLYRNERAEVVTEKAEQLKPSQWRFVKGSVVPPTASENRVFFIAQRTSVNDSTISTSQTAFDVVPYCSIFLDSSCERVGWHRFANALLYSCPLDRFIDVVYAFSEGALFDNLSDARLIDSLNTVSMPYNEISDSIIRADSPLAQSLTHLNQRPLSLLEQLYLGDRSWPEQFVSETALHVIGQRPFDSLPRRVYRSPRRRFRSCTTELRRSENILSCLLPELELQVQVHLFDHSQSLPPFFRALDHSYKTSTAKKPVTAMDSRGGGQSEANSDSVEISPSITIEEMDRPSTRCDGSTVDIPYVDDSDFGMSPRPIMEMQSQMAVIARREDNHLVKSPCENGAETQENEGIQANEQIQATEQVEAIGQIQQQDEEKPPATEAEPEPTEAQNNPLRGDRPPIANSHPPKMANGGTLRKKERSAFPPPATVTRRRHSAMVGYYGDDKQNGDSLRYRSLSPQSVGAARIRHSVCESAFADRSFFARDSFRRSYTPTRKFHATSDRSLRAMSKPPSILVYTGGQDELYSRIRSSLSCLVSSDRYTVFHLSPEAMKKQPWIEPTTACLIVADTNELDDHSWSNMQLYFNQAGKIIFVCQNRLLASLTTCGSSKKQADVIRMAFGSRDSISMGKDFEHFLKKSLKTLSKQGQVNATFHSKDFAGGMSYSVVLTKVKDTPLFLYMENSAHQASAIFSDATSEQLLAPGSRILSDSLSRVGVNITECTPPALTPAVMMAVEDELIENMMGVRYGEEVGQIPKLFLRKTERVAEQGMPDVSETLLPIEVLPRNTDRDDIGFDFSLYFSRLRTRNLGRVIVYVPVATTTMDINSSFCDAIPTCCGAVVVAGRQTQGKGRGGNEFVSPIGAAMFTVSTYIPQSSSLAKTPSFVQHIFAVALVDAVRRLSGIDDFPLRIKWPNDFYFNRSHKVGGLLAAARFRDDGLLVSIGAGINVSNSQPTVCLNDMVPEGSEMKFTIEDVIAETLNRFEYWINMHEIKGQSEVLKVYYEFWLHSREEVTIEQLAEKGIIRGLDKCGYLQVRSKKDPSQIFSVGDNGNTFDMMKGLIRHKIR